jgi:hypothetical protein
MKQSREARKPVVPVVNGIPHYNRQTVIDLFKSNDRRIRTNEYGTVKALYLSDEPGYFQYSEDEKGEGYATFYVDGYGDDAKAVFAVAAEITEGVRNARCHAPDCDCESDWTDICYNCHCNHHHEDEIYELIPRFELCTCPGDDINDRHVHLYGLCEVCFQIDAEDKEPKNINADNFRILVQDGNGSKDFYRWDEPETKQDNLLEMPVPTGVQ